MNNREILESRKKIEKEINALNLKRDLLKIKKQQLQKSCPHQLVFKFNDNARHKVGPIDICFCPICLKIENVYAYHLIDKTSFKNSKIVEISVQELSGVLDIIEKEVCSNLNYYYDSSIAKEELALSMNKKTNPNKIKNHYRK